VDEWLVAWDAAGGSCSLSRFLDALDQQDRRVGASLAIFGNLSVGSRFRPRGKVVPALEREHYKFVSLPNTFDGFRLLIGRELPTAELHQDWHELVPVALIGLAILEFELRKCENRHQLLLCNFPTNR
jgi:hypothetical protein